jgi:hypothetical protein
MLRVFSGAALIIAGIVAFIEAHSHRPIPAELPPKNLSPYVGVGGLRPASGLSQTAYDLLRIGGWALVIVGALLVVTGLIRYAAMQRG